MAGVSYGVFIRSAQRLYSSDSRQSLAPGNKKTGLQIVCKARFLLVSALVFDNRNQASSLLVVSSFGEILGRDGVIRTLDPLHPMQVRYQAALRPDKEKDSSTYF